MMTNLSSNINEVTKTVLSFLLFFTKRFYKYKKHKTAYSEQKLKNAYKKHLREKKSLIRLFAFCAFAWSCLYLLVLSVSAKSFRKKNKEFKRSQETSFCLIKTV